MSNALLDYNQPLTEEESRFAEEHHNAIYSFLNIHHLDKRQYYDVAAFGYLNAVRKYVNIDRLREYSFLTISFKSMKSSVYRCRESERIRKKLNICGNEEDMRGWIEDCITDPADEYEAVCESVMLQPKIQAIFSILSEDERKIFMLKSEGYIAEEIAAMMRYKVTTIYDKIQRARQRIRAQFGDACEVEKMKDIVGDGDMNATVNYGEFKRLYDMGLHDRAIALKSSHSQSTVKRWREKNGLEANQWKGEDGTPMRQSKKPAEPAATVVPITVEVSVSESNTPDAFSRINALVGMVRSGDSPEVVESYKTLMKKIFESELDSYFANFAQKNTANDIGSIASG